MSGDTRYVTIVFDAEKLGPAALAELMQSESARYLAWGHIPYQCHALRNELEKKESSLHG